MFKFSVSKLLICHGISNRLIYLILIPSPLWRRKFSAYLGKNIILGQATLFKFFSLGNLAKKTQNCWDLNKEKTFCKYA